MAKSRRGSAMRAISRQQRMVDLMKRWGNEALAGYCLEHECPLSGVPETFMLAEARKRYQELSQEADALFVYGEDYLVALRDFCLRFCPPVKRLDNQFLE